MYKVRVLLYFSFMCLFGLFLVDRKQQESLENKEDGEYYLDFYYEPDDERWTTSLEKDGKPVKTILFGNGYEKIKDGDTLREFTYIGNGLLHYRENGGESKLLYMFTDAQGSIREIYDRDGNVQKPI